MPEYATRLVGNVTDRWTKTGREREMDALSLAVSQYAQDEWRLHSILPISLFSMGRASGTVLLAVYEKDSASD
jgi:hypothetical protein